MEGNKVNNVQFDFVDFISSAWRQRKLILRACCIGAVFGLVAAFSVPKTYKASVVFAPEAQQQVGSGVSSIASMMGVTLNNSIDAINIDMFPDVLASSPFVYGLLDIPIETADGEIKTDFEDYMTNYQKRSWFSHLISAPFKLLALFMPEKDQEQEVEEFDKMNPPLRIRRIVSAFKENIEIYTDKNSGKTTLTLTMQDPLVAATVLENVVNHLRDYMCDYRTSKNRQDVENLQLIFNDRQRDYYEAQKAYADFLDANRNIILHSANVQQLKLQQEMDLAYQVFSQVATQLEGARIKEQQAKPVFVIIEPVKIPIHKYPSKLKYMIVYAFLAGFASLFWIILGKKYYTLIKSNLS